MAKPGHKAVASNRRARHDYEILETIEAGIALLGPEVKSLRAGRASLREAFAQIERGELFLRQMHISPYEPATRENPEPTRDRKLLVHRREIVKLAKRVNERGLTLIPLSLYFKDGRAKVELAVCRGKRSYDKRETIRRREQERDAQRVLRGRGGARRD
ncbi:MAG: SsrA-binding protein SmpB [bacterium]|nr:SsrA-binding protein SmpB [bacterium]